MILTWRNRLQQSYKLNRLRTWTHEVLNPCANPRVAFIFGCQRSGTTLLRNFIGLDWRFKDVGEGDPPYFHQQPGECYLRLIEDEAVEKLVLAQRSPWVLLKPLHDSQQAARLLRRFDRSRGIWIFRHYLSVVHSHLQYYKHDALDYLKPLREMDGASWMLAGLGRDSLKIIEDLVAHAGDHAPDLYAVFWFARNEQLFAQIKDAAMLVLSYEALVLEPNRCLGLLSNHLEVALSPTAATVPHQSSLKPKREIPLHPTIVDACNCMYERLCSLAA